MGQRTGRAAQVWACQIAEAIACAVEGGKALPFPLTQAGKLTKGKALRFCQEVNYAKKQEEGKGRRLTYWTLKAFKEGEDIYFLQVVPPSGRVREINTELLATAASIAEDLRKGENFPPSSNPAEAPEHAYVQPTQYRKPDDVDAQEEMLKKMYGL